MSRRGVALISATPLRTPGAREVRARRPSHLARLLRNEALHYGTNVVIDSVLSKPDAARALGERSRPPATRSKSSTSRSPTSSPRRASPNAGASPAREPSSHGKCSAADGSQASTPATSSTVRKAAPAHRPPPARWWPSARPSSDTVASGRRPRAPRCRSRSNWPTAARGRPLDYSLVEARRRSMTSVHRGRRGGNDSSRDAGPDR